LSVGLGYQQDTFDPRPVPLSRNYCGKVVHTRVTRLPSNLRQTTRNAYIQLDVVTSGHLITMAVTSFDLSYPKTPCYAKLHSSLCYKNGVIASQFYIAKMGIFDLFAPAASILARSPSYTNLAGIP